MAELHPLPFKGDIIDYIKLHGRSIEWLWRDGEAYIPARPICDLLGVAWQPQHRKLTAQDSEACVTTMVTQDTIGRAQEMLCIAYPDFMMWLATISPGRVNEAAREPLAALKREVRQLIANHYRERLLGEAAAYRRTNDRARIELLTRRPIYVKVEHFIRCGWSVEQMRRATSYSGRQIAEAAEHLFRLGLIGELPSGMPARQGDLFSQEG